jgi:hypothetical protein
MTRPGAPATIWRLLLAPSAGLAAASTYLIALLGATVVGRRRPPLALAGGDLPRFVVLVPAHDEERGIVSTIRSLEALDDPADRFEIVVIADNCSDRTASTQLPPAILPSAVTGRPGTRRTSTASKPANESAYQDHRAMTSLGSVAVDPA